MADEGVATKVGIRTRLIDQRPQIENVAELLGLAAEVTVLLKWKAKSEIETDKEVAGCREFAAKPIANCGTSPAPITSWTDELR